MQFYATDDSYITLASLEKNSEAAYPASGDRLCIDGVRTFWLGWNWRLNILLTPTPSIRILLKSILTLPWFSGTFLEFSVATHLSAGWAVPTNDNCIDLVKCFAGPGRGIYHSTDAYEMAKRHATGSTGFRC